MHVPREQLGWAFYAAGIALLLTALLIKEERHGCHVHRRMVAVVARQIGET